MITGTCLSIAVSIERVSFWSLHAAPSRITCEQLYLSTPDRYEHGLEIDEATAPGYFRALLQATVIAAEDAQRDERTREFRDGYLAPNRIGAMLDVPVWVRGRLAGVVCHEHVGGPRAWTFEEQELGNRRDNAELLDQLQAVA